MGSLGWKMTERTGPVWPISRAAGPAVGVDEAEEESLRRLLLLTKALGRRFVGAGVVCDVGEVDHNAAVWSVDAERSCDVGVCTASELMGPRWP